MKSLKIYLYEDYKDSKLRGYKYDLWYKVNYEFDLLADIKNLWYTKHLNKYYYTKANNE